MSYFIKVDDRWVIFTASSIREAVIQVADYCGNHDELYNTAINACTSDEETIKMHNHFAAYYGRINGIWELGRHITGDKE